MEELLEQIEELKELMLTMTEPKQMFSVKEFSILTSIREPRVRELCNIKGFPCTRDERKIYVHREALKWIKEREELPQKK